MTKKAIYNNIIIYKQQNVANGAKNLQNILTNVQYSHIIITITSGRGVIPHRRYSPRAIMADLVKFQSRRLQSG